MKNYYEILGVADNAKPEAITREFRKLAKDNHPDHFMQDETKRAAAEEKFKALSEAYTVLKDEKLRAQYDRKRKEESESEAQGDVNSHATSTQQGFAPEKMKREAWQELIDQYMATAQWAASPAMQMYLQQRKIYNEQHWSYAEYLLEQQGAPGKSTAAHEQDCIRFRKKDVPEESLSLREAIERETGMTMTALLEALHKAPEESATIQAAATFVALATGKHKNYTLDKEASPSLAANALEATAEHVVARCHDVSQQEFNAALEKLAPPGKDVPESLKKKTGKTSTGGRGFGGLGSR